MSEKLPKQVLFSTVMRPLHQADLAALKEAAGAMGVTLSTECIVEVLRAVGLLPLTDDSLSQRRLLQIVSDLLHNGYGQAAEELISLIKGDPCLSISPEDYIGNQDERT